MMGRRWLVLAGLAVLAALVAAAGILPTEDATDFTWGLATAFAIGALLSRFAGRGER